MNALRNLVKVTLGAVLKVCLTACVFLCSFTAYSSTVTLYPLNVAPDSVSENESVPFIRFYLLNDQSNQVYMTSIIVTKSGTIADANLQVSLYRSENNIWDASDTLIAGPQTFTSGKVTFTGLSEPATDTIKYYYFLVITPGSGTTGQPAGVNLVDPCFTLNAGTPVCTSTSYSPIPVGISADTMVVEPYDVAPFYAAPGKTDVSVLSFDLYALTGNVEWTALTLYLSGTGATDADVSAVKVYRESGLTPGFQPTEDVLISSGTDTFVSGSTTITLSSPEVIGAAPTKYYVVYDISPSASTLHNVGGTLQSTSFRLTPPDQVSSMNLPFSSKEIDIIEPDSSIGTLSYVVSTCNRVVFSWDFTGDENGDSYTRFEYSTNNTWGDADDVVACAEVRGTPVRNCTVVGVDLSTTPLYFRAVHFDPDGTSGGTAIDPQTAYVAVGPIDCTTVTGDPPVVNILSPGDGDVVAGNSSYPVLVQASVWDKETPHDQLTVEISIDGGPWTSTGWNYNANWENVDSNLYVYEYAWVPSLPGLHTIRVRAVDPDSNAGYAYYNLRVYVNSVITTTVGSTEVFPGSGLLLVRGAGSSMCMSCHSVGNHTGHVTGDVKYGNWATNCRVCHTPHGTRNIYLIKESIRTPSSGAKPVLFKALSGTAGDPNSGVLADDTDGVYTNICEVCHTETTYHRNNSSTPNPNHHNAENCTPCHKHIKGFMPSGGCIICHSVQQGTSRRAVPGDFTKTSHHVSTGMPTKDETCMACHGDLVAARRHPGLATTDPLTEVKDADTGSYVTIDPTASVDNNIAPYCTSCHDTDGAQNLPNPSQPFIDSGDTNSPPDVGWTGAVAHSTLGRDCLDCHGNAGASGTTLDPEYNAHGSTVSRLLAGLGIIAPTDPLEENLCFRCHSKTTDTNPGGGPAKTTAGYDYYGNATMNSSSEEIFSIFNTKAYVHPVTTISGVHNPQDGSAYNDGTLSVASRHSECEDCHNPHQATSSEPLKGASGVTVSNPTTQFTDLTSLNYTYDPDASVTVTQPDGTTQINLDYKVCLKCHSNWAYGSETNAPNPTPSATWQQTNMAKEFNVNNYSYHYVEGDKTTAAPLPSNGAGCNSYGPLAGSTQIPRASTTYGNFNHTYIGQMEPSLAGLTDAQIRKAKLRCSSCHGPDGADGGSTVPEGPHGSAYPFILKVPAGSPYTQWNNSVNYKNNKGSIWCFNCHDPNFTNTGFSGSRGNLHTSRHDGRACQYCHVAIPHGWKRYRLLVFYDCDSSPYVGITTATGLLSPVNWKTSGNWEKADCHNAGAVGDCG